MSLELERLTIGKITNRLAYFLAFLMLLSWIDRSNVSIGALHMNQDLKFSATVFGAGVGFFNIAYFIFEIPSNAILHRVGARVWFGRIMITWGIIASCFAFVHSATGFYTLRFLLGMAEAGFQPGVVYYLSQWYPSRHRGKVFAIVMSTSLLALVINGPISGGLMTVMSGVAGYAGWRWMFFFEGIPSIIAGIVTIFYLTNRPEEAKWLSSEQKTWLKSALEEDCRQHSTVEHHSVSAFLLDKRMWYLAAIYFLWNLGAWCIVIWLPLVLKNMGSHLTVLQISRLASVPFIFAFIGMHVISQHSDRTGERKFHLITAGVLAGVLLIISVYVPPVVAFILLCGACFVIWSIITVFYTVAAAHLGGMSAAAAIALITAAGGGAGGFLGPYMVGVVKDMTGKFQPAVIMMGCVFLVMSLAISFMKIKRDSGTQKIGESAHAATL